MQQSIPSLRPHAWYASGWHPLVTSIPLIVEVGLLAFFVCIRLSDGCVRASNPVSSLTRWVDCKSPTVCFGFFLLLLLTVLACLVSLCVRRLLFVLPMSFGFFGSCSSPWVLLVLSGAPCLGLAVCHSVIVLSFLGRSFASLNYIMYSLCRKADLSYVFKLG